MLEITGLVTAYGNIEALHGETMEAKEGEITCLLGPNGAGKTTLMFSIVGILHPRRGSVRLDGRELVGRSSAEVIRRGVALVPENRLVFPEISVRENLRLGAYVREPGDKTGVKKDIERMLERFPRLADRIGHDAGTLSGGEQQMLAVARALMARPRLLLMDEPSLGLGPMIVEEIFRTIKELNQEGTTIFLVEQNVHKALQIAHKFYLLEQGRVTFSGAPGELQEDEVIQRAYLGSSRTSS